MSHFSSITNSPKMAVSSYRSQFRYNRSSSSDFIRNLLGETPEEDDREPTPVFSYDMDDFNWEVCSKPGGCCEFEESKFETQMQQRWDRAKTKDAFHYELNLLYKLLPGKFRLTAQLNVDRGQKRRKPHPFRTLAAPFDHRRFNYNNIRRKEILLDLRRTDRPLTEDTLDRHLLIVNPSPIERSHCLVVPCVTRCLPQRLTEPAIQLMIQLMLLTKSNSFHVLFNSLLAYASVNHLHFHTLYWPYFPEITKRSVQKLCEGVSILQAPEDWFVPAFVFQLTKPSNLDSFVRLLLLSARFLHRRNVAHNLFMVRAPRIEPETPKTPTSPVIVNGPASFRGTPHIPLFLTVYLFPRRSVYGRGAKPASKFNPASCELAGNLLVYNDRFFSSINENNVLRIIEDEAGLDEGQFEDLCTELPEFLANPTDSDPESGEHDSGPSFSCYHTRANTIQEFTEE